jgi:hypothetical protein
MKLFEFAVIFQPIATREQEERGEEPEALLIVDVTRVLADSDKNAMMLAARAIPEQYAKRLAQCEIALRPF